MAVAACADLSATSNGFSCGSRSLPVRLPVPVAVPAGPHRADCRAVLPGPRQPATLNDVESIHSGEITVSTFYDRYLSKCEVNEADLERTVVVLIIDRRMCLSPAAAI